MHTLHIPLTDAELFYKDDASGEMWSQPMTDILEVGTLIDPGTGEDLEPDHLKIERDPAAFALLLIQFLDEYENYEGQDVYTLIDTWAGVFAGA